MTVATGMSARIVAYVRINPGCERMEMARALGISDPRWSLPTYCRKAGLIFAAGPRSWTRYFPTEQEAKAAHPVICKQAEAQRQAKVREQAVLGNLRKLMKRAESGRISHPSKHRIKLEPGVTLHPKVKITIATPPKERWAA